MLWKAPQSAPLTHLRERLRTPFVSLTPKRFALLFLAWTALGVFLATPGSMNGYWWPGLLAKIIEQWVWAFMTPVLILMVGALGVLENRPLVRIVTVILISVPFSLVVLFLDCLAQFPFSAIAWNPFRNPFYYPYYFLAAWMTYCTLIGILEALRYHQQNRAEHDKRQRLEKRLLEVHLNALRMQLEPHFLFNGLNAISSVVVSDPRLARDMLGHFSTLLRLSVEFNNRSEIPLTEEIDLLEHYLMIQRIRFGDRLKFVVSVEPNARFALVPCFLLQPLVENAIRHGLSGCLSDGVVTVSAKTAGDEVQISVHDNGAGLPAGWSLSTCRGVGLRITRERVMGYYPESSPRFDVRRREGGGTEVLLALPLRLVGEHALEPVSA